MRKVAKNYKNKYVFWGMVCLSVLLVCFILLVVCLGIGTWMSVNNTEKLLQQELVSEVDKIPAAVIGGTLYWKGNTYSVYDVLQKENKDFYLGEIFCVKEERIFFSFSYPAEETWYMASIGTDDNDLTVHAQMNQTKGFCNAAGNRSVPYEERDCFYVDEKIVLHSRETILEYHITTKETASFASNDYRFPTVKQTGDPTGEESFVLMLEGKAIPFTLSEMAWSSEGISAIYGMKDKKTATGTPYLQNFIRGASFCEIDHNSYLIGELLCFSGDSFAVILAYDREVNEWKYVTGYHVGGDVANNSYLIPSD